MTRAKRRESVDGQFLADYVFEWALVPLRAVEVIKRADPDDPSRTIVTQRYRPLQVPEQNEFRRACELIADAAKGRIDITTLAQQIAKTLLKGVRASAIADAPMQVRLDPGERGEYRKRAHAAQEIAQWLATQATERPVRVQIKCEDGFSYYNYLDSEANGEARSLADVLRQKMWARINNEMRGTLALDTSMLGREDTLRYAPELSRLVELVNSLHWLAGLLREDCTRSRPTGRRPAPWKHTAQLLRELFNRELGKPLLRAVRALVGLAHQCHVPPQELSRLSKT